MHQDGPEHEPDERSFRAVSEPGDRLPTALVVVALVVVGIAFLARQTTTAPNDEPASPPPAPTAIEAAPSASARAVTVVTQPELTLPDQNPGASPHPTPRVEPPERGPGPADLLPAGNANITLTTTLPAGWLHAGDSMYVHLAADETPDASISAWNIDRVHVFPCRWSAGTFASPLLMQTARGQAEALSSWWGQDAGIPYANSDLAPLATRPRELAFGEPAAFGDPAAFGGATAWYTSVLITRGFDLSACDAGEIVLWGAEDLVRTGKPGELHELYIVEIDGDVIVIDATSTPDLTASERSELRDIVASVSMAN